MRSLGGSAAIDVVGEGDNRLELVFFFQYSIVWVRGYITDLLNELSHIPRPN